MPANIIKSFAKESGKSEDKVEELWNKAKKLAAEAGHADEYDYITGILKKMLNLNETNSFKEFLSLKKFERNQQPGEF